MTNEVILGVQKVVMCTTKTPESPTCQYRETVALVSGFCCVGEFLVNVKSSLYAVTQ